MAPGERRKTVAKKPSNPKSKQKLLKSITAPCADGTNAAEFVDLTGALDAPETLSLDELDESEAEKGGAEGENELQCVHEPEEVRVPEGEDEKVSEVEDVVRDATEVEGCERREEEEKDLGSVDSVDKKGSYGGEERLGDVVLSTVVEEVEVKEETFEEVKDLGNAMKEHSSLNAVEKGGSAGEERRQGAEVMSTVAGLEAKKVIIEEEKNLDTVMPEIFILSAEESAMKGADVSEEQGEVKLGENDDEESGGPLMDVDGEEKIEVEEREAPVFQDDTSSAKEVDCVVVEGGQSSDDEEVNGEANEEVNEANGEVNEEDSEDEELCRDFCNYLTDRKKLKEIEIYIGRLDRRVVEEDLVDIFGKFGEVKSTHIVRRQNDKGYGFIRYATSEQAKNVLSVLKDGIEVRGSLARIEAGQDNQTLKLGNICKTWTKEHVLETLRGYGIEHIEDIYLPQDSMREGKIKGVALLEFSSNFDAMAALRRLRKPDAVFGRDRSTKVAIARIPMQEDAESKAKTIYVEGLADSWDDEKVREFCEPYGTIEKVILSRNLGTKRRDFGFIIFTTRESALACLEGINSAQIGAGEVKVKANIAKPHFRDQLQMQGTRDGFKVEDEVKEERKINESPLSKKKHHRSGGSKKKAKVMAAEKGEASKRKEKVVAKEKREASKKEEKALAGEKGKAARKKEGAVIKEKRKAVKRKEKVVAEEKGKAVKRKEKVVAGNKGALPNSVNIGGKPKKAKSISEGQDVGASHKKGKENRKRNRSTFQDDDRGKGDKYHGSRKRPKNRPQGNTRRNQMATFREGPPPGTSLISYGNQYARGYAAPSKSSYNIHSYKAISGSKIQLADMEPHAGFLGPSIGRKGQTSSGYSDPTHRMQCLPHAGYLTPGIGVQSAGGYNGRGSSGAAYGQGSACPPPYVQNYTSRVVYKGGGYGGSSGGYHYSSARY